ncbi:hypothetical protein GGR58DRAFT_464313 [Xylaria digitata]|nr:hypothetical protein GGR58DRAFT_464313 [Xylaria digitata]
MNPATLPFRPRREQDIIGGALPFTPQDSRSQVNCKFYQNGSCRNGQNCRYRHQEGTDLEVNSITRSPNDYVQPTEKKITRTISGALAHFGEGAGVTEVLFTTDLSAVQLIGLPHNSTPTSVLGLLQSRGLDTSAVSHVRVARRETSSEARVEAKARHFAELVVAKFGRQSTLQQGPRVTAVPIPVNVFPSSSSSSLRVDCKKVHCSWHKPNKTIWLNFGDEKVAKRVSERFKKGEYKILNQIVHPSDPTRGVGLFNTKAWTVRLTGVPSSATKSDISSAVQSQWDIPRGIELGTPTYTADAETCATKIQSLFTAVGPLEWWEFTHDTTGKRMKASARFLSEEDAKDAVALHDSPLPFHKTAKLTVQLVYCARFKVSSLIYDAVERQIKGHISKWKAQYLHFTAYEQSQPPKWYRTVKLEGEDSKTVAEAKNVISGIFAGIVAKEGSSNLWHPSLRGNGEISSKLAQLQQQTGVVILPNKAKSQLRLFGPLKRCEQVQATISEILKDQRSVNFTIELDEEKFLWARLGGYKKLAVELGPESVSLDVVSKPKRIIITGTETKYNVALSIINGKVRQNSKPDPNGQDCATCWTEAENPIQTHCGHTYCLDCFENMCLSAPTQDSAVEIRCVGDSGSCNTVLDIPQLQEHLSSTAFEELLEQSFASYARLHPHLIRYCPSPDCDYVYRVSATAKMQTCTNCLVPVCTKCHAQHGAMNCAEYQDISSGRQEANEKLKREIGIKDCPKCRTPLEKTEGCDHMTCRCGAHICWVCLETFALSDDCYRHMNREHGGIGLGHYQ